MPATAEVVLVADAIAADLAAAAARDEFSQEFVPARSYQSETRLEDLGTLHVDVVPVTPDPEVEARLSVACRSQVDVAIRKRLDGEELDPDTDRPLAASVDALMLLEQEIFCWLVNRRLSTYSGAAFAGGQVRAGWVPAHLDQLNQFTGILRVTYESSVALPERT
jgi:hypothetical protein